MQSGKYFISYSRKDSEFVKKLAIDLKKSGEDVWLDQLDIAPGTPWDECIQNALNDAEGLIVILSNAFVKSNNVMDEVSYGISKGKKIFPLMVENCPIPFRLARLQYLDFTGDYNASFDHLLKAMNTSQPGGFQPSASEVSASSVGQSKKTSIKRSKVLPVIILVVAFLIGFFLFKNGKGTNAVTNTSQPNSKREDSTKTTDPPVPSGKVEETSSPQPATQNKVAETGGVNLFDAANGVEILVATRDDWKQSIDGKESKFLGYTKDEVVYGFKNGMSATFDTFTMLISGTSDYNVREFELFAGNDKPLGAFHSIGKFQTENVKLFKTPYQEFKFTPVTAKYFKVKLLSNYANGANNFYCEEFQLFGKSK